MELTERQKKHLRRLGHALHPLVTLGGQSGLTEGVALEMERALTDHELVKVKSWLPERESREAAFATLATQTHSALVQRIGHVGLFYRPHKGIKRILLPD